MSSFRIAVWSWPCLCAFVAVVPRGLRWRLSHLYRYPATDLPDPSSIPSTVLHHRRSRNGVTNDSVPHCCQPLGTNLVLRSGWSPHVLNAAKITIYTITDHVACTAATLYDNVHASSPAAGTGNTSGVTWWAMMNGSLYEESPPPPPPPPANQSATTPSSGMTSPVAAATVPPPATTSTTSSTSPSSVTSSSTGPLHIPAKRLGATAYTAECAAEPGVIRHSHHSTQPWNYENHTAFEPGLNHHQYPNAPTYYNLADRDSRTKPGSGLFWSPAATAGATAPEYKYSATMAAPSADPAVSSCHQSFSQSWCNYSPYSTTSSRHPVDHHAHAQYLTPTDDRGRVAAAMVAAETAGFTTHDGYGLRNYGAPEPVPSTPYPPPGESASLHWTVFPKVFQEFTHIFWLWETLK